MSTPPDLRRLPAFAARERLDMLPLKHSHWCGHVLRSSSEARLQQRPGWSRRRSARGTRARATVAVAV